VSATPPRGPNAPGAQPFLALAGDALKTVWRERSALLLIAILPAIGSFLLELVLVSTGLLALIDPTAGRVPTGGEALTMLLIGGINLAFVTMFSVAWTRHLLVGPARGLGISWGRRELGYLARLVGILLTTVLATFLLSMVLALIGLVATPAGASFATAAGIALALFIYVRAMLILPAAAIDRPLPIAQALEATRGTRAIWLALALLLVILPYLVLFFAVAIILNASGLGAAAPYASLFIQAMLGYAMQATIVALQALIYRHLIGGTRGLTAVSS